MYRIVLCWDEVPHDVGAQAAIDIKDEFVQHRHWHQNVSCTWAEIENRVILQADNDFDKKGLALMDEFSDAIDAYVKDSGDGGIRIISVTKLDA